MAMAAGKLKNPKIQKPNLRLQRHLPGNFRGDFAYCNILQHWFSTFGIMRLGGHIVEECERKHALSEQYAANLNPQHLVSRLCCHSALQEIQPCMIIFQSSFNLKLPGKLLQGLTRSDFYDFNGGSSGCCGRRGSRCGCGAGQCFPINDIGVVVGKLGAGGAQDAPSCWKAS